MGRRLTGPALYHYRHFEVAVDDTGGEHISNTIEFLPTKYNIPMTSPDDQIIAALEEIWSAIKHLQLRTPFLNGDATNKIMQELIEIFQTETALPRVPVKTTIVTPNGSPRVPNKQQPSESTAPRVPIKKLFFVPHQLGTIIYKQFHNKNYQGIIVNHDARKNYIIQILYPLVGVG